MNALTKYAAKKKLTDKLLIKILGEKPGVMKLLQNITLYGGAGGLGLGQCGEKESRQDGDDGNDHQQLDEREGSFHGRAQASPKPTAGQQLRLAKRSAGYSLEDLQ